MKNLMLALLMLTFGSAVAKENDKITLDLHYLCLNTVAAGLNWSSGKWVQANYHPLGQFQLEIMIIDTVFSDGSKHEFIHFTRNGDSGNSHCGNERSGMGALLFGELSCSETGETIIFSQEESRGGISSLLGSESSGDERDSLMVAPFTCQKT